MCFHSAAMDELDADNKRLTAGGRIAERDIVQVRFSNTQSPLNTEYTENN